MCYITILSTTSNIELTKYNSDDLVFSKEMPGIPEEKLLKYPYTWYVGSSQGCSCGFRHLMVCNFEDLGFAEPVDWFPEEPEDISATLKLVRVFKEIISDNSKLECIDAWSNELDELPVLSGSIVVSLSRISEPAFRLIENYQHEITN